MKRYILCLFLAVSIVLGGCGWLDGSYVSVTPHQQQTMDGESREVEAANYLQLRTVLEDMVCVGMENQVVHVREFDPEKLESSLDMAVRYVKSTYPLGAYAVDEITCEVGTSGGVPAVAVQINYLHDRAEIQRIHRVSGMEGVEQWIVDALVQCDTTLVMLIENYEPTDISQLVEDYASNYPSKVMEMPAVTEQTYPNGGRQRILELKMTYQSSREALRNMQSQVQRIFNSAALYVSSDASEGQKFGQLFSFLMERFSEYQIKTSITPAYSLLNHGVGDSRAFATVYAQMCREAGLECLVVVGTRNGEPWTWNMIREGEYYYHVDLLDCGVVGKFRVRTDEQMESYVWDYSAYPVCTGAPAVVPEETTVPTENAPSAEDEKNAEEFVN